MENLPGILAKPVASSFQCLYMSLIKQTLPIRLTFGITAKWCYLGIQTTASSGVIQRQPCKLQKRWVNKNTENSLIKASKKMRKYMYNYFWFSYGKILLFQWPENPCWRGPFQHHSHIVNRSFFKWPIVRHYSIFFACSIIWRAQYVVSV